MEKRIDRMHPCFPMSHGGQRIDVERVRDGVLEHYNFT